MERGEGNIKCIKNRKIMVPSKEVNGLEKERRVIQHPLEKERRKQTNKRK